MPSKRGRAKRRQHPYRRHKDSGSPGFRGNHRCRECGKWCYRTRDDAEAAVRLLFPGAKVHYYKCGDWWHFTSMTAEQVGGIRARGAAEDDGEELPEPEERVA